MAAERGTVAPDSTRIKVPLWKNVIFRRVWLGQSATMIASQFGVLAMPLVALESLHASASAVALLSTASVLPFVVFGITSGLVVDRFGRKLALVTCSSLRAAVLLSIPLAYAFDSLSLGQLFVVAWLDGSLNVVWMTAYRSFVPAVVSKDRLPEAYSMVGASDGVSRTVAPSAVGGTIQVLGPPIAMLTQGLFYVVSAVAHASIHYDIEANTDSSRDGIKSFARGAQFIRANAVVRRLAAAESTYQLFQGIVQGILVVYLTRNLGFPAGLVGVLLSAGTVGGVVAALGARWIGKALGTGLALFLGCVLRSTGLAVIPIASLLGGIAAPAVVIGLLINGIGWTLYEVYQDSTQQGAIPDDYRGRINGTVLFMSMTGLCIGTVVASAVVNAVGIPITMTAGSIGSLLACLWVIPGKTSSDSGHFCGM